MKTILTAAAAATMAIALPIGLASAQNNNAPGLDRAPGLNNNPGVGADVRGNVNANANANLGNSQETFGAAISAMNNAKTSTSDISGITDASNVSVVKVDFKGSNQAAFDNAMSRNENDITSLRTAIEGNAQLWQKLQDENVSLDNIVGIDTKADGTVIVYVSG